MRTYELVFVARPELDEEGLDALVESVQQVITENGGQIVKIERMGRRRLAYPIQHLQEGHYVLIHAVLEDRTIAELERSLKLAEDVIRHILIRVAETVQTESG